MLKSYRTSHLYQLSFTGLEFIDVFSINKAYKRYRSGWKLGR